MLPTQILLNNLLYDLSESTIPTDNVDPEYTETPKKMDIPFVRRYMIFLGPISSIFDFLTFFIMLFVFNASISLFQTAWFIESLTSQTLIIFVIRTRRVPFYKSKPSRLLLFSSVGIVGLALIIPFTPLSILFKFMPPFTFYIILAGLIGTYFVLALFIFVIRRRTPFYKSKPSRLLFFSSVGIIGLALIILFIPLGPLFEFVSPPFTFYIILAGLIGAYFVLVEIVKKWFYKRYAHRLEQSRPPKKSSSEDSFLTHNLG